MIAMYYPPAGGVGTFRVTKFAKYLREFGWEPIILTLDQECYNEFNFFIDDSLVKDIPERMSIYKTGLWKPIFLKNLLKDPGIRWLPPLFRGIKSIINKEKPKLLYATSGPAIPLIVTTYAKFFCGINYIIDLRDPWKLAIPDKPVRGLYSRMNRTLNNILEPLVINNASKIICVSEDMCQAYREAYSRRSPDDFIVITNGYDPDDFDSVPPLEYPEYTIIYAGKFLAGPSFRNPTYFFQAMKLLQQRNIRIHFIHIGEVNKEVIEIAKDTGLTDQSEFLGKLSYRDTISHMKGAGLLLLIGSGIKTEQTGKVFDYLGCKKPILALSPKKGGIADVVRDMNHVILIENENPYKIAEAIEKMYVTSNYSNIQEINSSKYLRKNLTETLSEVFNKVAGTNLS